HRRPFMRGGTRIRPGPASPIPQRGLLRPSVSPAAPSRSRPSRLPSSGPDSSPSARRTSTHPPRPVRPSSRPPPHEDVLLVGADHLVPLALHDPAEGDDTAADLGRLARLP